MQRIAALILCAAFWGPNASAGTCTTIGNIVGGFAGGATGYGLVRNLGMATNWVSAGLFGAGIAVGAMGGAAFGKGACEHIHAIMKVTMEIYCAAGEYLCETIDEVVQSLTRDFQVCSGCTPDEIIGAFLMEDSAREQHLMDMQSRRGLQASSVGVLPRNNLFTANAMAIDSYYVGMHAGFRQQRALMRRLRLD